MNPDQAQLLASLPSKWHTYAHDIIILFLIVRPIIRSIVSGNGLVGMWKSLLYGSHEMPAQSEPTKKP
jgi:hypothetical protein